MRRGSCPMCGAGVSIDIEGNVVAHDPVASCATLAKPASDADLPVVEPGRPRPCCRFFMVGHTMYKGIYLPSVEEYVAHGYKRENFDAAMAEWKDSIDRTGRP